MTGRRRGREEHCLAWLQKQVVLAIAVSGQAGGWRWWRCPGATQRGLSSVYRHHCTTRNMCDRAQAQSATENRFPFDTRQTTPQARWGTTWVGWAETAAASGGPVRTSAASGRLLGGRYGSEFAGPVVPVRCTSVLLSCRPAVLTKGFRFSSRCSGGVMMSA